LVKLVVIDIFLMVRKFATKFYKVRVQLLKKKLSKSTHVLSTITPIHPLFSHISITPLLNAFIIAKSTGIQIWDVDNTNQSKMDVSLLHEWEFHSLSVPSSQHNPYAPVLHAFRLNSDQVIAIGIGKHVHLYSLVTLTHLRTLVFSLDIIGISSMTDGPIISVSHENGVHLFATDTWLCVGAMIVDGIHFAGYHPNAKIGCDDFVIVDTHGVIQFYAGSRQNTVNTDSISTESISMSTNMGEFNEFVRTDAIQPETVEKTDQISSDHGDTDVGKENRNPNPSMSTHIGPILSEIEEKDMEIDMDIDPPVSSGPTSLFIKKKIDSTLHSLKKKRDERKKIMEKKRMKMKKRFKSGGGGGRFENLPTVDEDKEIAKTEMVFRSEKAMAKSDAALGIMASNAGHPGTMGSDGDIVEVTGTEKRVSFKPNLNLFIHQEKEFRHCPQLDESQMGMFKTKQKRKRKIMPMWKKYENWKNHKFNQSHLNWSMND